MNSRGPGSKLSKNLRVVITSTGAQSSERLLSGSDCASRSRSARERSVAARDFFMLEGSLGKAVAPARVVGAMVDIVADANRTPIAQRFVTSLAGAAI